MNEFNEKFIEHINIINALYEQVSALIDLIRATDDTADIESIKTAAEMSETMLDELEDEVQKIYVEWKEEKRCAE